MSSSPALAAAGPAESASLQAALRLLRAVRRRKGIMVAALVVSGVLGALYYLTVARVYQSQASLLVLQTGDDTATTRMSNERSAKDLIATYRNMVASDSVLLEAIRRLPAEARIDLQETPEKEWPERLRRQLTVSNLRGTLILEIAYQSRDPRAAAVVVDAVLSSYLDFMDRLHRSTAHEILDILTREKRDLEERLQARQRELLQVRQAAGELVLQEGAQETTMPTKRVVELSQALTSIHEKRLEAEAQLAVVQADIEAGRDLHQHVLTMMDSVGREVVLQRLGMSSADAQTVARMSQELLENQARLQAELRIYGPAHSRVLELQQRIQVAEQYLLNRREAEKSAMFRVSREEVAPMILEMARQQLAQAAAHERAVLASYEQEKGRALQMDGVLARLEIIRLDLARLRNFYDVVLQRMKDIDMGRESGMIRTSILARPEVPLRPVWPRLRVVGLLALLAGLALGLGTIYVLDLLDDHFRTPEELRTQLGVPVLAMVGKLKSLETELGAAAIHAHVDPASGETEPFRTLRTALAFIEGGAQRIVISSSEPGDGKTTVVANLATVYAQSGKRTLLIDADMRRPGLTGLLNLRSRPGLSTVLAADAPVEKVAGEVLRRALVPNLDVLASGPRPVNPTELLAGRRFAELLAWAESHYDQVLIDSPPALVSDTAIIGRLVDGVLIAVRPEKNCRRMVIRAVESFPALGVRVLGVVVNRLREEDAGYDGYGYGYGYGYGRDEEEAEPQRSAA